MDTKWKVLLVTLIFGFVGFNLQANGPMGEAIWGAAPDTGAPGPTDAQVGLLIAVAALEALAFGLAFAFVFFGWKKVASTPGVSAGLATAAAAAITWGLVSWVPHSAMHITNGDNFARLIFIEYAFHVTLIFAASILALFAYRLSTRGTQPATMRAHNDADAPVMTAR